MIVTGLESVSVSERERKSGSAKPSGCRSVGDGEQ